MKILIVEDSKMMAMMVKDMLDKLNHTAFIANDGKDACHKLVELGDFDIILLDWNMPNMNGLEFLQHNQQNNLTKASIIMMTTEDKPEKIQKALEFGAVEYIMKPFTVEILESKLNELDSFL